VFPTREAEEQERQRLFALLSRLVRWEALQDAPLFAEARLEIARSFARAELADAGEHREIAGQILDPSAEDGLVRRFLRTVVPPVHDPFAGGGSIPVEAMRLGLRAVATDLNPVAVLINRAQIELATEFFDQPALFARQVTSPFMGFGAFAADLRALGEIVRDRARKEIGPLYPLRVLPKELGTGLATPIAYLWARTVASPDPAYRGVHTPLISNCLLSDRAIRAAWMDIVVDRKDHSWSSIVRHGEPPNREVIEAGTKSGRGTYQCIFSGAPIDSKYLRAEGQAGRLGRRLIAVVAEQRNERFYLSPTSEDERRGKSDIPRWEPDTELPDEALGFRVQNYGIHRHADLFLPRQLCSLSAFAAIIREVAAEAERAYAQRSSAMGVPQVQAAKRYGDAVAVFLAFALSKLADWSSMFCGFIYGYEKYGHTFGKQTLSMIWDFAELNPLSDAVGNWHNHVGWVADAIEMLPRAGEGSASTADAANLPADIGWRGRRIFSTDPPYYDNIGYADLSDFFYIWLRHCLRERLPAFFTTMLVPKIPELVAAPERFGGDRHLAKLHFEQGLQSAFGHLLAQSDRRTPITVYYAFKQSEAETDAVGDRAHASTGWEAMLSALIDNGFQLTGTWPIRTERTGRLRDIGSNALASSIILVCRPRDASAGTTTRADFRRALRSELPTALQVLQQGNIAPVDVNQSAIGPGIAIYSRYLRVLEADGSVMSVRSALQLINEALDQCLAAQEGDFDADTRFAITWYEQHQWEAGAYGDAENIAKARNVSVQGIVEAGICRSGAGKVRLLRRDELPAEYDLAADERPTVWEFTQHMIRYLEEQGEDATARHMKRLGSRADATRELAYRLFNTCDRKKWTDDARSYNGLILAWPELEKLAAGMSDESAVTAPSMPGKAKAATKGQRDLFEGGKK
jgi:putative DNA methylase